MRKPHQTRRKELKNQTLATNHTRHVPHSIYLILPMNAISDFLRYNFYVAADSFVGVSKNSVTAAFGGGMHHWQLTI